MYYITRNWALYGYFYVIFSRFATVCTRSHTHSERSGSVGEGVFGLDILICGFETDDQVGWDQVKKFVDILISGFPPVLHVISNWHLSGLNMMKILCMELLWIHGVSWSKITWTGWMDRRLPTNQFIQPQECSWQPPGPRSAFGHELKGWGVLHQWIARKGNFYRKICTQSGVRHDMTDWKANQNRIPTSAVTTTFKYEYIWTDKIIAILQY